MTVSNIPTPTYARERGRFAAPKPVHGDIERRHLGAALTVASGRVAVVVAPAGYGKSTVATQWVHADARAVSWLELEPADDDPVVLMRSIVSALSGLDGADEAVLGRGLIHESFEVFLAAIDEPFLLVLDEVEHVRGDAAARVVQQVAAALGGVSTMVLAGRDIHEGLGSELRLSPGTVELGAEQLAFDDGEVSTLVGRRVGSDDLEAFSEQAARLEGWPAGLVLAISNLHRAAFDGSSTPEEFVVTIWLAQLDADERALLAELACLGRFHPDMCGDVLGRTGCRAELRRLRRRQFVFDALDERGDWFRLHPIVGDWLSQELRSDDRERWVAIHRAAADWWQRAGDVDLAFHFAAATGDTDRCIDIIAEYGGPFVSDGRHRTVQRWFEALGDETTLAVPQLCATAAAVETQLGDFTKALRWSRSFTHAVERQPVPDEVRWRAAIYEAAFELRPTIELRPALEVAVRHTPPNAWRSFGCWALGGFRYLHGDVADAIAILDEGSFEARIAGVHRLDANNAAMKATIEYLEGDASATAAAVEAYRRLEQLVPDITPPAANLVAMVALHEAQHGRRDRAVDMMHRSEAMVQGFGEVSGWYQAYTYVVLATTALLIGETPAARRSVDRAARALQREGREHRLAAHLDALEARVAAAERLGLDPAWSLTTAELNVLRYLPTNLSLADIAGELYVSRNTVKSHTASIYRKLGTTSRAGTVEAARAAGMLPVQQNS